MGNYSRTLIKGLQDLFPENSYILYTPKIKNSDEIDYFCDKDRFEVITPRNKRLKDFWRSWGVVKNIKKDNIDIYHGLSHDLPFSVRGGNKGKTKYVVTIHDVCYKTYPDMFKPIDRMIYSLKYRHSIKVADAIITISESSKRDIIKYFPFVDVSKIHTIYQSLNPIYYKPMDIKEAVGVVKKVGIEGEYLLYVGSINSRKNLLGVVMAYNLLPEEKRLPLVIIGGGNGGYKDKVMKYVADNNLGGNIHFFTNITSSMELKAFYTAATAMVFPSFYEGLGLPVAEALLCNTPVITSNISSLPEAAGCGAIYVDPHSPEEIKAAMMKIMDNKEFAKELATKGRQYVIDSFDSKRINEQVMELYTNINK